MRVLDLMWPPQPREDAHVVRSLQLARFLALLGVLDCRTW